MVELSACPMTMIAPGDNPLSGNEIVEASEASVTLRICPIVFIW